MRAAAVVAALLLLSGCTGKAPAEADATPSTAPFAPLDQYSYRGAACVELSLDVPVDAAKVRPLVPARYRVTEVQGRALVAIAFARCDRMVPEGAAQARQVVQADIAVQIEGGFYELFYATSDRTIAESADRAAFPAIHAPTSTLLGYPLQSTDTVQAHIEGEGFQVDAQATAARAPAAGPAGGTYFQSGPNGTSRLVYDVQTATVGPAKGTLTVPTGSTLAAVFGSTRAEGAGSYGSFSLGANLTRLPG